MPHGEETGRLVGSAPALPAHPSCPSESRGLKGPRGKPLRSATMLAINLNHCPTAATSESAAGAGTGSTWEDMPESGRAPRVCTSKPPIKAASAADCRFSSSREGPSSSNWQSGPGRGCRRPRLRNKPAVAARSRLGEHRASDHGQPLVLDAAPAGIRDGLKPVCLPQVWVRPLASACNQGPRPRPSDLRQQLGLSAAAQDMYGPRHRSPRSE